MSKEASTTMRESVKRFAHTQRSPRTAQTYGIAAEAFLRFIGRRAQPQRRHVELFLARPLQSGARAAPATYNQNLAAVRAFSTFAVRSGLWRFDPTTGIEFEREPENDPSFLQIPEIQDFFQAVPSVSASRWRVRDLAVLALGFIHGLRVSEIESLDARQIDFRSLSIVRLRRKGGRVQTLPLERRTARLLAAWIRIRADIVQPNEASLLVSDRGTRLSVRSMQRLFERIRRHLQLPKHITPHSARHSFVTAELDLGVDITVVSNAVGHRSIVTTMRYRHLLDRAPRAAIARLGGLIADDLLRVASLDQDDSIAAPGQLQFEFQRFSDQLGVPVIPANDLLDAQENMDDIALPAELARSAVRSATSDTTAATPTCCSKL